MTANGTCRNDLRVLSNCIFSLRISNLPQVPGQPTSAPQLAAQAAASAVMREAAASAVVNVLQVRQAAPMSYQNVRTPS